MVKWKQTSETLIHGIQMFYIKKKYSSNLHQISVENIEKIL